MPDLSSGNAAKTTLDLKIERLHHFTPVTICTGLEERPPFNSKGMKKSTPVTEALQFSENHSALQCDLFSLRQYFFFWFSSESPPQDLKLKELTFLFQVGKETVWRGGTKTEKRRNKDKKSAGGGACESRLDCPDVHSRRGRKQDNRKYDCRWFYREKCGCRDKSHRNTEGREGERCAGRTGRDRSTAGAAVGGGKKVRPPFSSCRLHLECERADHHPGDHNILRFLTSTNTFIEIFAALFTFLTEQLRPNPIWEFLAGSETGHGKQWTASTSLRSQVCSKNVPGPVSPTSSWICRLWMLMCVPPPTRSLEKSTHGTWTQRSLPISLEFLREQDRNESTRSSPAATSGTSSKEVTTKTGRQSS